MDSLPFWKISFVWLVLPFSLGCGQPSVSPVTLDANVSSTDSTRSVIAESPTRTGLSITPRPDIQSWLEVGGALGDSPEFQAYSFSGGTVLLHLICYSDFKNQQESEFHSVEGAEQGEMIRRVWGSCVLGPAPIIATSGIDQSELTSLAIRVITSRWNDDFTQVILQSNERVSNQSVSGWRVTHWGHVGPKVRSGVKSPDEYLTIRGEEYLAASQFPLNAFVKTSPGMAMTQLGKDTVIVPGQSEMIFWVSNEQGQQLALIAECLPFGARPDEQALRSCLKELANQVTADSDDPSKVYYSAWCRTILSQHVSTGKESWELTLQAANDLQRLADREPANVSFRDSLRKVLARQIAISPLHKPASTDSLVKRFLALEPTCMECEEVMKGLAEADADQKQNIQAVLRFALESGLLSSRLTMQRVERFRNTINAGHPYSGRPIHGALVEILDEFENRTKKEITSE